MASIILSAVAVPSSSIVPTKAILPSLIPTAPPCIAPYGASLVKPNVSLMVAMLALVIRVSNCMVFSLDIGLIFINKL
ncbi:hypothetical protein [Moraxella lacunata]|uniref:hypothetical protein n=1 Tax=Moraxella lacunata TaxID=477 RepID=UPI003EE24D7B